MFNPHSGGIESQCLPLNLGTIYELSGGYKNTRKASSFQVSDVMHTA